ncbi:adenosine deaminase 2 isoform X1 [Neodiprion pinetum]|uniref:adenosine deaminase 2 isoform X1 n=1 Tax=Neodiprion pinetum TaxID=441929 RepID=UPI001EE0817A|nr:adenosine deaminase 2-like isoform X1 [Neodiprion pinetum]
MNGLWWRCLSLCIFIGTSIGAPASEPSSDDNYWAQRSRFLIEESQVSLGGRMHFEYGERAANNILMAAKEEEVDEGFVDPSSFLPARNFLTVVDEVRGSSTFQIIEKMPKGAALHIHDTALTSADFVFENITFRDDLYVCRPADGSFQFRFRRVADKKVTCASSEGWELLADLRANSSIKDEVDTRIRQAMTMIVPDPAKAYPNVNVAWIAFQNIFITIEPMLTYLPVYEDYYYQGLYELYDDNVLYLELRSTLPTLYDLDGNQYGPIEVARLYKETTERFVKDHPDFIGTRLIYAPLRNANDRQMDDYLTTFAALRKEFPDFVIGFDLVGQEEKGEPLARFVDKLRAVSPSIRLFLHAGETNWNGLSTDENLIDAILLNATRIGHGYALLKHPRVLELAVEREVAIEVNPISNQVLTLVGDMRNHPASFLFARDYPVVLSADDPGLWGARGLSYDFYEAFVGIMSRSADIRALKQLALNSIKYSAMPDEEKVRAYEIWTEKWAKFITDMTYEYSIVSRSKRSCEVDFVPT